MLMSPIDTAYASPRPGGEPSGAGLADHLEARMGGLEDAFRNGGETLASAIGTIDAMADGLDGIRRSLAPETAGAAVNRMREVAYRLLTLPTIQGRRAIEVETLNGRTRQLQALLGEVGTILKLLGIYGLNIKIVSSGEPAFLNFVAGMDDKLLNGRQELDRIERQLGQFGQVVHDVQQADRRLAGEFARTGASVPADVTANANALQHHVEAVVRMTDEVSGIMRTVQGEVARILGAIQIGDSVRQRTEHAIVMLRRVVPQDAALALPAGAQAHMARLIAAQLTAMAQEYGTEIVAIVSSLDRLGSLADHLQDLLGTQGGEDGQILIRLESGIARLGEVTDQLCDADAQVAELTGFVTRTLGELTEGLGRIRTIALDVQDISTNTRLLCRRHGMLGQAVAVIAKEVAPCATRLDELSGAVGQLVGTFAAIDLVQDSTGQGGGTRGALDEALAVVRQACASSGAAVARSDGEARRILDSIRVSALELGEQRAFADTLAAVAQELEMIACAAHPGAEVDSLSADDVTALAELLPWAAGLYTMASERAIHADFLLPGMAPPSLPSVTTATFDDDDDGLF